MTLKKNKKIKSNGKKGFTQALSNLKLEFAM